MSLVCYALLISVAQDLSTAEPTFIGQLVAKIPLLQKCDMGLQHRATAPIALALFAGLFVLYSLSVRFLCKSGSASTFAVFAFPALFYAILTFSPSMFSMDPFLYALYGRLKALFGGDPYSATAIFPANDPFVPLWEPGYLASRYGPLWTHLSSLLAISAGDNIALSVLQYRLVGTAASLLTGALIYATLLRISPEKASSGVVFYLWNPLVALESVLNAHNESVMLAFIMLAFLLFAGTRYKLATVAVICASLVKAIAVVILPLFIIQSVFATATLRKKVETGLALCFISAACYSLVVFFYPRSAAALLESGGSSGFYTNSLHEIVFHKLQVTFGRDPLLSGVAPHFRGWWLTTDHKSELWSGKPAEGNSTLADHAMPGDACLVLAPQQSKWVYVINTRTYVRGFLDSASASLVSRPVWADSDRRLQAVENNGAKGSPSHHANMIVRVISIVGFLLVWVFAATHIGSVQRLASSVTWVFLAAYWLLLGWFWPWYVLWSLGPAALAIGSTASIGALAFSASALSLYIVTGFPSCAYDWRALFIFVPPLVVISLNKIIKRFLFAGSVASS